MTTKLNAAALRELQAIQPEVHAVLVEFQKERRTRKLFYESKARGFKLYLAEGAHYQFFSPGGEVLVADMISDNTVGARGGHGGINYQVGKYTPGLPEGTWVVETELFLGTWIAHVYCIGVNQLAMRKDGDGWT